MGQHGNTDHGNTDHGNTHYSEESATAKNARENPDDLARREPLLRDSVCLRCLDHRTIVSGKGSVFLLCQSEQVPREWPKYPRQPLFRCPYFRVAQESRTN